MDNVKTDFLTELGFSATLVSNALLRIRQGFEQFNLADKFHGDKCTLRVMARLRFTAPDRLILESYEAILQYPLVPKHMLAEQIDSAALEKLMQQVNWDATEFTAAYMLQHGSMYAGLENLVLSIVDKLHLLSRCGNEGLVVSEQLKLKYWYDTAFSREYLSLQDMDTYVRKYYPARVFTIAQPFPTLAQAIDLLQQTLNPSSSRRDRRRKSSGKNNKGK